MLDYILLAIVAILGIGLGLFTLNEAKKLQATRTEHGISADNTDWLINDIGHQKPIYGPSFLVFQQIMKKSKNLKRRSHPIVPSSVLSEEELARNIARTKRHLETTQNQFLARLTKSQSFFKQHHEVGLLAGSIQSF